jgi:uracil-DNA glycosylase
MAGAATDAREFLPERLSLSALREAAAGCRACDLWKCGSQTVFGEGLRKAQLMLVGEQPGDREDREGRPFVGPAGRILAEALGDAGISRKDTYVTNAVKHFKWREGRGKRRLHQRPDAGEIRACNPWLEAELAVVKPHVVVCLGATAARALLGSAFRVTRDHGTFIEGQGGALLTGTLHPSAILRADPPENDEMRAVLVADLAAAAKKV